MGFGAMMKMLILAGVLSAVAADGNVLFEVGGENGWVMNPSENYNHWAQRSRFQIHDTLYFKYNKGENSVLMVTQGDYENCNTGNPIVKMDAGDSYFTFDRSGPFYFISGQDCNCLQGQKLIVVVLSPRSPPPPPSPVSPPPPPPPVVPDASPRSTVSPSPSPNGIEPTASSSPAASSSTATTVYTSPALVSAVVGFSIMAAYSWMDLIIF